MTGLVSPRRSGRSGSPASAAAFGGLIALAMLLLPDSFGRHGGELSGRLAVVPPVLWLACFRPPVGRTRRLLAAATLGVVGANLVSVTLYVAAANRDLAEFTAGVAAAPPGEVVLVTACGGQAGEAVDPLEHAANLYGLAWHAVNLDNYEADTELFPVRFRAGWGRGRGEWEGYPHRAVVDTVLVWRCDLPPAPPGFVLTFRSRRLSLFQLVPGCAARAAPPGDRP